MSAEASSFVDGEEKAGKNSPDLSQQHEKVNSLSTTEDKFQPIVLSVNVVKAVNVPVGDIHSSDPYCILYLGSKRIGKTSVRKWTVNPTWNQNFALPLLHLKNSLLIEVWDHDTGRTDDILAKVEVELSDLPANVKIEKDLKLERASQSIKPRGSIKLEIFVKRNDTLIDVESYKIDSNDASLPESSLEAVRSMLQESNTPNPLQNVFLDSEITRLDLYHWSFYRDLLYDVQNAFSAKLDVNVSSEDDLDHMLNMQIIRKRSSDPHLRLSKTTRIHLRTNSISHSPYPSLGYSLVLETSSEVVTFVAPHRYRYWDFLKSLRRLHYFCLMVKNSNDIESLMINQLHYLPEEITDYENDSMNTVSFGGTMKVFSKYSSKVCLCRLQPKLMRLDVLDLESQHKIFHVDVSDLNYIHLGVEAEVYKPYDLALGITSGKLPRNVMQLSGCSKKEMEEALQDSALSQKGNGKWYPGKYITNTIIDTGQTVKSTVTGATNTITSATSSVLSAISSKQIRTRVSINVPGSTFYITKDLEGLNPFWDETSHHRVQLSELVTTMSSEKFGQDENEDKPAGFLIHLLGDSAEVTTSVLASNFIRFGEVVSPSIVDHVTERAVHCQGGKPSRSTHHSFPLDKSVRLRIRVVRGECLSTVRDNSLSIDSIITGTTDTLRAGVHVLSSVASLRPLDGFRSSSTAQDDDEVPPNRKPCVFAAFARHDGSLVNETSTHRTKSIPDTCDPAWNETIVLNPDDGLYSAQCVMLHVQDRYRKHSVNGKMGHAIIPLESFFTESLLSGEKILKRLPILPTEGMPEALLKYAEGSLGHLLVELKLDIDTISPNEYQKKNNQFPISIDLKSKLQSASEYSTAFPCEAVARSIIQNEVPTDVEKFHVAAGLDGLVLFRDDYKNSSINEMKEKAAQALMHQFQRYYTVDGVDMVEFHVFENQRRVFLEWGARNLMSFERTAYTEESGCTSCPFNNHDVKMKPPDGFEWLDESKDKWLVDKEYTNTDADGWVYGTDFGFIMQNLRKGESCTTSHLRSVRRRRWKRIAYKKDVEEMSDSMPPPPEADAHKDGIAQHSAQETSVFHVFYNQRRSILTLTFGPGNLFPTDRHAFSDNTGQHAFPNCKEIDDIPPPTGYKWAEGSIWKIDQTYTNTDEFGWSYAVDFHYLESNLKKGKSSTSSKFQSVRRKKYYRSIVPSESKGIESFAHQDADSKFSEAGQLSEDANSSRQAAYLQNNNSILGLCKERKNLTSPIVIPWSQLKRLDVVSPSVLSLGIEVHRFFGENEHGLEVYRKVDMELFVLDCPSEDLYTLFEDRCHLATLRENLTALISTGNMSGRVDEVSYDELGAVTEEGSAITARELSLGSYTIEKLYVESLRIEKERSKLNDRLKEETDSTTSQKLQQRKLHLTRLLARIRLYISLLLSASLVGPSYDEADVKNLIAADRDEAKRLFETSSDDQAAKQTVSFLLDMAELRVRDYALCGWSHQGNLLEDCLRKLINGYYINIVEALGYFFDSKDAIESLQGNESKLKLIEFIIENDNHFNLLVQDALMPYNLKIVPAPLISLSLSIESLMEWYSELLHDEMKGFVLRTFEVSSTSMPPNSPQEYFLPWEVSNDHGKLVSSIPLDTGNIIKGYLSLTQSRFRDNYFSSDVLAGMKFIEKKVKVFYVECLFHLASQYFQYLCRHDWTSPLPLSNGMSYEDDVAFNAIGDHLDWLSSVANDCFRISHNFLDSGDESLEETDKERKEWSKSASNQITSTMRLALEYVSCIFFKSFDGTVPTSDIFSVWSTTPELTSKLIEECMWYIQSRFDCLDSPCRAMLLEICLRKVIAWYLHFLRECYKNSKVSLSDEHYAQIGSDVQLIVNSFTKKNEEFSSDEQPEYNRISHELRRFETVFVLLTQPVGSVMYTTAVCNILEDIKLYPGEGKAMASCIKAIFKISQKNNVSKGGVNEFGVQPDKYIDTIIKEVSNAAGGVTKDSKQALYSLSPYVLVFEAKTSIADYFVHSPTYIAEERCATPTEKPPKQSDSKAAKSSEGRRSSIAQMKKFLHL